MAADIEINNKSRKPSATSKKSFSLDDFKKDVGAEDSPDKPFEWIKCSDAVGEVFGVPGIAKGYVNLARGFSNTGKSTLLCEAVVSAQKMGILPIIIDTENNLGQKRLKLMGFDFDKEHILIDNEYLLKRFGKEQNKNRNSAAIEDLGKCINFFLDQQEDGNLPRDILFAVDSIGTLDCIKSIDAAEKDSTNNNLWNAGAWASSLFKNIMNFRIPNSKKQNKEFTNTFIGVQKVWFDSMVGGSGCLRHSGGEALYSASRMIFHFGGTKSHGSSKVVATSQKKDVVFGIKVSGTIAKSHINDQLGGIAFAGEEIISTPHGFISATKESIDEYKKNNLKFFREILGGDIELSDIETKIVKIKNDEELDFGGVDNEN